MKFLILLVFMFMSLANPIIGGKIFPGFNNPEKWMKRVIRKLQRKTSAYGNMIASNTAEISNTAGFISSMTPKCQSNYINDPDNSLSCCFEDNLNKGQCLCNGMTIDDTSNPGSCCIANQRHPDHCLCSGTDIDDPNNPGNCCFKDANNPNQCLCNGNYTDIPNKRCFNLDWKGDGICDDQNNHAGCDFDGKDCCGEDVDTDLCTLCQCLEDEAPLPNAVGCCYPDPNTTGECLCTDTDIDDPDNAGSCCIEDPDSPGTCCVDSITCNGQGTCSIGDSGICTCDSGFTGDRCNVTTCPGVPVCSSNGNCPQGGTVCECQDGFHGDVCATFCNAATTCSGNGTCAGDGSCTCDAGLTGVNCNEIFQYICEAGLTGSNCNETYRYILTTGGWPLDEMKSTEIIDVLDPTRSCSLDSAADYPVATAGIEGGMINGKAVACGGNSKNCYVFENSKWNHFATLTHWRKESGSVVLKGKTPLEDKLWIWASISGGVATETNEFVHANGTVTIGPSIPNTGDFQGLQGYGHQLVALENGDVMIMLGIKVWRYNFPTNTFTRQQDMVASRYPAGATTFYSPKHDGRHVIFIGGGSYSNNPYTCALLDYTITEEWEILPNLPHALDNGPRALPTPTGDGVFMIYQSKIYELSCDSTSCSWTTKAQQFPSGKARISNFLAFYIPEELTNCT